MEDLLKIYYLLFIYLFIIYYLLFIEDLLKELLVHFINFSSEIVQQDC